MDKPSNLLGIYIPTRNRPAELEECLASIIPQVKKYGFPIYISDNSLNEETAKLIKRLKKDYSRLFYEKNQIPVKTYASNILNLLDIGNTEYVWFFGDDDLLEPGAIDRIVKELSSGFGFLLVCLFPYSKNMKQSYPDMIFPKKEKDIIYEKGEQDKVLVDANISFLGGAIVDKSRLDNAIEDSTKPTDEGLISTKLDKLLEPRFTHLFCYLALTGFKGKMIAKPLVRYRMGNNGSEEDVVLRVALEYKHDAIDYLKGPFSIEVCNSLMKWNMTALAPMVITAKLSQPDKVRENKEVIWNCRQLSFSRRIFLISLLSVPAPAYKLMQTILHSTKGKSW